jgi:hypothetical protein
MKVGKLAPYLGAARTPARARAARWGSEKHAMATGMTAGSRRIIPIERRDQPLLSPNARAMLGTLFKSLAVIVFAGWLAVIVMGSVSMRETAALFQSLRATVEGTS